MTTVAPTVSAPRRVLANLQRHAPVIVVTVVAIWYVVANVMRHTQMMSVYDEAIYLDYLISLPGNAVLQTGEHFSMGGRELMSCVGTTFYGTAAAPCGSDYSDLSAYPLGGVTSGAAYTPLYFYISWVVTKTFMFVGIGFIDAARLSSMIWLIPTALFLLASLRRLRVPAAVSTAITCLFIVLPYSWWTFTYVSTDAPATLIGAISVWLMIRVMQTRTSAWWFVLVAAVGSALKVTTLFGPLLATVGLFVFWLTQLIVRNRRSRGVSTANDFRLERRIRFGQWFWPMAVAGIALVVVQAGWIVIQQAIALGENPDQGLVIGLGIWGEFLNEITKTLRMTADSTPDVPGMSGWPYSLMSVYRAAMPIVLAAGVFAAFLRRPRGASEQALGIALPVAATTFLPLLFIVLIVTGNGFALPARYAGVLLPAMLVGLGLSAEGKVARVLIVAGAAVLTAWMLIFVPPIVPGVSD